MIKQSALEMPSQSIINILKSHWHHFNKNYRETLKYLWALAQEHDFVFPDYERIAEMCGYSLKTAKNICKALNKLGLISWQKRGYRPNLYFLPDELIKFNLRDRRLFRKSSSESYTVCYPVPNNIDSCKHVHCDEPSAPAPASPDVPIDLEEKRQHLKKGYESLPPALKIGFMKEFDFKNGSWILDRLTERDVQEILEDMKWFIKKQKVKSYCGLFVSRALKYLGFGIKKETEHERAT